VPRSNRFPRGPRRTTQWLEGPKDTNREVSVSSSTIWSTGILAGLNTTIVRIRGYASFWLTSATSPGDGFLGAVGIGLVSENSFLAGAASVPAPITDMEWDGWMFHQFFDIRTLSATHGDGVNAVKAVATFDVDTKAMRKWEADNMILMGVSQFVETGTAVLESEIRTRVLVKLA